MTTNGFTINIHIENEIKWLNEFILIYYVYYQD